MPRTSATRSCRRVDGDWLTVSDVPATTIDAVRVAVPVCGATVNCTVPLPTPVDEVVSQAASETARHTVDSGLTVTVTCSLPPSDVSAAAVLASCTVGTSTAKLRDTDAAACHCASPLCAACTVHVPAASIRASAPLTTHTAGVVLVSVTGRPELDTARSGTGGLVTACVATVSKVMVCCVRCTVTVRVPAERPGASVSVPACSHAMRTVRVPTSLNCTVTVVDVVPSARVSGLAGANVAPVPSAVSEKRTLPDSAEGRPCASTTCTVSVTGVLRATIVAPVRVTPVASVAVASACSSATESTPEPSSAVDAKFVRTAVSLASVTPVSPRAASSAADRLGTGCCPRATAMIRAASDASVSISATESMPDTAERRTTSFRSDTPDRLSPLAELTPIAT